ncbi:MAG: glycosyltransferase family 39 protein [Candidatus Aenigmarchaeota archaeon]|nr:glycosyltransferase family 39 protein [Candidatus Aenigmarchaeota archaeon]
MKRIYWLLALEVVLAYSISVFFSLGFQDLVWDDSHYLKTAEYWYDGNEAFKDFYLQPSPHFRLQNLSPLLSVIEYLSYLVFNINLVPIKLISAAFLPLLVFGSFKLGSMIEDEKFGVIVSALMILNQTIFFWSTRLYNDIPGISLFILAAYFLIKGTKEDYRKNYFISGIIFGLALLMRSPLAPLIGLFGLSYLFLNKKLNWKVFYLASVLIPLLPWLIYSQIQFGDFLDGFKGYATPLVFQPMNPIMNIPVFFKSVDIVWLFLFAIGILFTRKISDPKLLLAIISLGIFLITPFGDIRYTIPAIALGSFLVAKSLGEFSKLKVGNHIIIISIVFIVFLNLPSFIQTQKENFYCAQNSAVIKVSEFLKDNSKPDSIIFAESFWPQIEFYSKRDTYGLVGETPYLDYLMNLDRVRYIISINPQNHIKYLEGFKPLAEFKDGCRTLYLYGR